jgi:hypothetical protein
MQPANGVLRDQELFAAALSGIPSHTRIHGHSEEITAGRLSSKSSVKGSLPVGPAALV